MIKYFLIILLFSCSFLRKIPILQRPAVSNSYVIKWKSKGNEPGVKSYKIQQSTNNRNWVTIPSIPITPTYLPDSNVYSYTVPTPRTDRYYRIVANMVKGSYISKTIYVKVNK